MRLRSASLFYFTATALVSLALASPSRADTIFTDRDEFLTHVAPRYYLETFSSLSEQLYPNPLNFSGNGFAYTASATNGLYPAAPNGNVALSTDDALFPLNIVFTGAPVTAVGGYLFGSDINGNYIQGNIIMSLDDGTQVIVPNALLTSFAGIVTDKPINSLMIYTDEYLYGDVLGYDIWPATDDFIVGTAVPEPSGLSLVISIGILFALIRVRRYRQVRPKDCPLTTNIRGFEQAAKLLPSMEYLTNRLISGFEGRNPEKCGVDCGAGPGATWSKATGWIDLSNPPRTSSPVSECRPGGQGRHLLSVGYSGEDEHQQCSGHEE